MAVIGNMIQQQLLNLCPINLKSVDGLPLFFTVKCTFYKCTEVTVNVNKMLM